MARLELAEPGALAEGQAGHAAAGSPGGPVAPPDGALSRERAAIQSLEFLGFPKISLNFTMILLSFLQRFSKETKVLGGPAMS